MIWTLDAAVRASLVLLAGLGLARALHTRPAALRHAILAGAIFGSVLVPAGRLLPDVTIPVPLPAPAARAAGGPALVVATPAPAAPSARVAPAGVSRWTMLWFAGFLAVGSLLAAEAIRFRRTAARAVPLDDDRWRRTADEVETAFGLSRRVSLLKTATPDVLATSGLLHPRILVPVTAAAWPDERIRVVLCHEIAHIRRRDWAVQVAAEVACAVCWFNPLIWIACTRLRRESEHACDDLVVAAGVPPVDYASHLLDIARTCRRPARMRVAMTMARLSTLHRRIAVMLNTTLDHRPLRSRRLVWLASLLCAAAASAVTMQARQSGPAPLSGTVYDPSGAVLPGVVLTLRDANGADQTATTTASGRFEFPVVAPGHYRLRTSLPGFRTLDTQFDLRDPRDWDRPIMLQVGSLQETVNVSATRVAAGPYTTPPGAQPVRVGGNIRAPRKLVDVRPVYPPEMRAAGREGIVSLEAIVRGDGTVGSVRVLTAEVHPDFAIAAADAVRQWRFSPTLLNGSPVDVVMNVSIAFKLSD